jgi:DNA/RNA endonuclease YhcR with UshA esterase domain
LGERAQTAGQVRRVQDISDVLRIITLRDGNAVADVVLPLTLPGFDNPPQFQVGDWISVTGGVGEFRDARQLLPSSASDIAAHAATQYTLRPINALDKDLLGQWVAVKGIVSDLRPFNQGMRVDMRDDSDATITVVMFDSVWQSLPFSQTLFVDDVIRVQGELAEYRGELEVLPELAADVEIVSR